MPELPDVMLYVESLDRLLGDQTIRGVRVRSPFVMRTFDPPIEAIIDHRVTGFSRRGKRIVWQIEDAPYVVVHPMISGRFHWKKPGYAARGKHDLVAFDFDDGTMMLTEVGKQKRAGLWVLATIDQVNDLDPGGMDVINGDFEQFRERLLQQRRTLKRSLSDPKQFDGIGNAYSDEILHAAKLSPLRRTDQLNSDEIERLHEAVKSTLNHWIDLLRKQNGEGFPEKVTAFRPEMSVHGKFKEACPECGAPVQRIRYADNECNYCPGCQTDGRILSDRSLARLLKDDWPKTLDDLEA